MRELPLRVLGAGGAERATRGEVPAGRLQLGVKTRVEAAVFAMRRGLIEMAGEPGT